VAATVRRAHCVGSCAFDHRRVEVQPGHIQAMRAGQHDREVAGSAPDLEQPRAVRRSRRDVGSDPSEERGEH
jgi:hypothetical protein